MFYKKNVVTIKKNPKVFKKKKYFTERKFEKCWEAKRCTKGHITGRRKNFDQKTLPRPINEKSVFSISYFEKCFYMQSLPTTNFSLVWRNFCTPYWVMDIAFPYISLTLLLFVFFVFKSFLSFSYRKSSNHEMETEIFNLWNLDIQWMLRLSTFKSDFL